jgi:hypothetical protein
LIVGGTDTERSRFTHTDEIETIILHTIRVARCIAAGTVQTTQLRAKVLLYTKDEQQHRKKTQLALHAVVFIGFN